MLVSKEKVLSFACYVCGISVAKAALRDIYIEQGMEEGSVDEMMQKKEGMAQLVFLLIGVFLFLFSSFLVEVDMVSKSFASTPLRVLKLFGLAMIVFHLFRGRSPQTTWITLRQLLKK